MTTQISVQVAKECVQIPGGRRLKTGGGRLIVGEGALTMGGRYLLVRIDKLTDAGRILAAREGAASASFTALLTTQRPDNAASRP